MVEAENLASANDDDEFESTRRSSGVSSLSNDSADPSKRASLRKSLETKRNSLGLFDERGDIFRSLGFIDDHGRDVVEIDLNDGSLENSALPPSDADLAAAEGPDEDAPAPPPTRGPSLDMLAASSPERPPPDPPAPAPEPEPEPPRETPSPHAKYGLDAEAIFGAIDEDDDDGAEPPAADDRSEDLGQ